MAFVNVNHQHATFEKQLDNLIYWMNERQRIYLAKESGEPWPWTQDKILQTFKFTNVFREQDRDSGASLSLMQKRFAGGYLLENLSLSAV